MVPMKVLDKKKHRKDVMLKGLVASHLASQLFFKAFMLPALSQRWRRGWKHGTPFIHGEEQFQELTPGTNLPFPF